MANTFAFNTTDHPTLAQVLVATDDGLFDFNAQKSGASVVVPAGQTRKLAALRTLKHPTTGRPFLNES